MKFFSRLLCTGVLPFLYLSILNLLIYSRVFNSLNGVDVGFSFGSNIPYFLIFEVTYITEG